MTGKFDFIETDKRIVDRKLRRHQLSPQEYQKTLKALPDDKEFAEEIEVAVDESAESKS